MKHLTKLHMMALALAFMMFSGTSVFAADSSNDLNEGSHLLSTSDFSALSGISADSMNEAELDQIQGKFTPNPECYSGCLSPRGPFPPRPWYRQYRQTLTLKKGALRGMSAVAFNPQPEPPAKLRGKILF